MASARRERASLTLTLALTPTPTLSLTLTLTLSLTLTSLPILKTEADRKAIVEAVRVCDRLFLGTDSAPHAIDKKESGCGCAGCFSAHTALELYAEESDSEP